MRVAVFSDIHGNAVALDAVLADMRADAIDQAVCLGDAIQGGPQPAEVVQRLRALACPVVMGNADAWLLSGADSGAEAIDPARQRVMDDVRVWMLARLSPADQAFIAAFEPTVEIALGNGQTLLCFHGSPASFDDIILPSTSDDELAALLGASHASFFSGGHTHLQQLRRLGERRFFNPGSVGLAYSHQQAGDDFRADAWAEYALLSVEGGRVAIEFRRVPFGAAALVEVYRSSGRPHAEAAIAQYRR